MTVSNLSIARRHRQAGFSLAEMLIVVAIIGIAVAIGIPLVNEQVRIAEVRTAADQLAIHLRAARMIAVSKHKNIVVTVGADPTNSYSYEGTNGDTRTIAMPGVVKIMGSSATSVTFKVDGSTTAATTITIESVVSGATERWTVTTNTLGLTKLAHTRVSS